MRPVVFALLLGFMVCGHALGLGQDQLYTGSATTVAPGEVQFQFFYNTIFTGGLRLTGTSFTFGATGNADVKLGYGFLWNDTGPNAQIGPTIGAKWRLVGNGRTNASVAVSGLYAINQGVGGENRKNDAGGLLILQYPTRYVVLLANYGRVWVGDNIPDLRYVAVALAKPMTPRTLVAAQYISVSQIGMGPPGRQLEQYVGAIVYQAKHRTGYSLQVGFAPNGQRSHWNSTFGLSKFF